MKSYQLKIRLLKQEINPYRGMKCQKTLKVTDFEERFSGLEEF
jgi:hypothetical protein